MSTSPEPKAMRDLKARCAEILGWQRTGVLRGDALRSYADQRYPGEVHKLMMAERDTAREAFQFVIDAKEHP